MTFEEIIDKVRIEFGAADVSNVQGTLAYQFNLTGEGAGTFYVEVKDGKVSVEPYEYYDRNAMFTSSSNTFLKIMDGKLDSVEAFVTGKLKVDGDFGKALEINQFIEKSKK